MQKLRNTPALITERLILNRFTIEDTKAMFRGWANSEAVTKWMFLKPGKTIEECEAYIKTIIYGYGQETDNHQWAIRIEEECIGTFALFVDSRNNSAHFAYLLNEAYWGKGYASEVLKAVILFAFETLKLHRIAADHFIENVGSGRVMQKAGMIQEGVSKDKYYKFGSYHDSVNYGIISECE